MRPSIRNRPRKHAKGQTDHLDAWLMSYADMITLLFMFFVILVSATYHPYENAKYMMRGDSTKPWEKTRNGLLTIGTLYDEVYPALVGVVVQNKADRNIAIEKMPRALWIDISTTEFFEKGTADLTQEEAGVMRGLARALAFSIGSDDRIEVEGYTDDGPLGPGRFDNNWELAAMQAVRVVNLLIEAGVPESQLHASSYASNEPVVPNADILGKPILQNRERNQRVVIKISKAGLQ